MYLEGGLREAGGAITAGVTLTKLGYRLWDVTRSRCLQPDTQEYAFLAVPEKPS